MELSQRRKQLLGRLLHRKTREREEMVLVEGVRAVEEALSAGAGGVFAVASPRLASIQGGLRLLERLAADRVETVEVSDAALAQLSDTEHPQGILMVSREPKGDLTTIRSGVRLLVLDGIQDPGNVGTLIRAATAFALDGVVVLEGTADPWGAKALRASAGMAFRVPVLQIPWIEAVAGFQAADLPVLAADAGGGDVADAPVGSGWALVVGNEGAGPRASVRAHASAVVAVPMPGAAESLNVGVAGSILLYALTRR